MSDNLENMMFDYLDELRESGKINMFGAGPYLERQFSIDKYVAKEVLVSWMNGFKST